MIPHLTAAAALNTHTKTAVHNVPGGVATVHCPPQRWSHQAVIGTPTEGGPLKLDRRRETSTDTLGDVDEEIIIDMRDPGSQQDEDDGDHNIRRHPPTTSHDAFQPTRRFPQSGYEPYSIDFTHYTSPVAARTPGVAHSDASSPAATPSTLSRSPTPPPSLRRAARPPPIDVVAAQAYPSKKMAQTEQIHQHTHKHIHEHVHEHVSDTGVQRSVADACTTDIRERPQGPRPNNDRYGLASATADPFRVSSEELGMEAASATEARSRAAPATNPPAGTITTTDPATFATSHQTATSDLPPQLPSDVDLRAMQPADGTYPPWYPTWGRKPSPYASSGQEDHEMHTVPLTPARPRATPAAVPGSPLSEWRRPLGGAYSAVKNAAQRGSEWLESKPQRVHFSTDAAERGEATSGTGVAPVLAPVAGISYAFQTGSPKRVDIDARPRGYRTGPAPWEKKKDKKRRKWIPVVVLVVLLIVGLAVGLGIKKTVSKPSETNGTGTATNSGSTKGTGTGSVSKTIVDQCVSAFRAGMVDGLDCAMCAPAFSDMTNIPPGTNSSPDDINHAHPRILQYCALEDIVATMSNDAYAYLLSKGWTSSLDPCGIAAWEGIECNDDGLVIGLTISGTAIPTTIPESLSNIASLDSVEIEGNATFPSGTFPSAVLGGLGMLSIVNTSMSGIAFDGTVQMPNLTVLRLADNPALEFGPDVPDFSGFTSLASLTISNAGFSSLDVTHLPSSLYYLDLSSNNLEGRVPTLNKLTSLITLYLQNNKFTAPPALFPDSMETLSLASNSDLKGNMPLYTCDSSTLIECDLRGTQLMGTQGTPKCSVCTFE